MRMVTLTLAVLTQIKFGTRRVLLRCWVRRLVCSAVHSILLRILRTLTTPLTAKLSPTVSKRISCKPILTRPNNKPRSLYRPQTLHNRSLPTRSNKHNRQPTLIKCNLRLTQHNLPPQMLVSHPRCWQSMATSLMLWRQLTLTAAG